jgi:hypothetical protein
MAHFASKVKCDWSPATASLVEHAAQIAHTASTRLEADGISDSGDISAFEHHGEQAANFTYRTLPPDTFKILLTDSISSRPLHKALVLLDVIKEQQDHRFRGYELLALAKILVFSVSNLHFGPEVGVSRIKKFDAPVISTWQSAVHAMANDLQELHGHGETPTAIHRADARQMREIIKPRSIDAVITSPPYPNEKDYTRTTRLESVLLGFINNKVELQTLKRSLLRSNTRNVYKGDADDEWIAEHEQIQDYPVVAKLLEYRTVQKATTSYGENILNEISRVTGRVHANFHQIGAPTGRFSCTNPNVQQVPHEAEYRRCFRAPAGRKLVIADYSQVELRILADVTGDQGFIDAFNSGADLHRVTAAEVFGVKVEDVTSEQRSFSKRLNFGVVYGIGANRFSAMTGLPLADAEEIMRRYFATYRALNNWLREAAQKALRDREARTPLGRRARFFFDPADRQAASLAQRNGKNMPIQGASADILKRALRFLHDDLRGTTARLVNIVHDEVVVEADESVAEETTEILKNAMCRAGEEYVKRVPIAVEAHVADEWLKD